MVKGPCRGAKCDFWARAKIQKTSVEDLVSKARESIHECKKNNGGTTLDDALNQFWTDFGLKDLDLLQKEKPMLYQKIKQVQEEILA